MNSVLEQLTCVRLVSTMRVLFSNLRIIVFYMPRSAGAKSLLREEEIDSQIQRHVVTYGLGESSDWRAIMLVPNPQGGTDYTVVSGPVQQG